MAQLRGPSMEARCGVSLRPFDLRWAPLLWEWRIDTSNVFLWLADRTVIDLESFQKELTALRQGAVEAMLIFHRSSTSPIGFIFADERSHRRTSCELVLFVDEAYRGRGIAPAAFCLMASQLFFTHSVGKIRMRTTGWNQASSSMVKHAQERGWLHHEGREEREVLMAGKAHPVDHWAMFAEDFQRLVRSPLWNRMIGSSDHWANIWN